MSQRLLEEKVRHNQEMEAETGRLRATGLQAERALESREKAHHQRVKELEGQVTSDAPTPYRRCPGAAGHNARNSWMKLYSYRREAT